MNINQQITWLDQQLRHMKSHLPIAVAEGRVSEQHATHKLACAQAALETLTQLRGLVTRGECKQ